MGTQVPRDAASTLRWTKELYDWAYVIPGISNHANTKYYKSTRNFPDLVELKKEKPGNFYDN